MGSFSLQDTFLNKLRKERVPVTIYVTNGFQIKNALIISFDSFVILIESENKQMLIYKHALSSLVPAQNIDAAAGEKDD